MESSLESFQLFTSDGRFSDANTGDHFTIDDLLNLPPDEAVVAAVDLDFQTPSNGSSSNGYSSGQFPAEPLDQFCGGELFVPNEEMAELEWLSNFQEESFSSEDLETLHLLQGIQSQTQNPTHFESASNPNFSSGAPPSVSAKAARSKRSRAAPDDWTSRLPTVGKKASLREKEAAEIAGRKCLHCATGKTPQWRTGPLGPKTLCNACGVRYKSGRLVPEYRPAASPTFVLSKHSNSHRKVLELRRQKELVRAQQHSYNQNMVYDVASNGEDFFIHQYVAADFRRLI